MNKAAYKMDNLMHSLANVATLLVKQQSDINDMSFVVLSLAISAKEQEHLFLTVAYIIEQTLSVENKEALLRLANRTRLLREFSDQLSHIKTKIKEIHDNVVAILQVSDRSNPDYINIIDYVLTQAHTAIKKVGIIKFEYMKQLY